MNTLTRSFLITLVATCLRGGCAKENSDAEVKNVQQKRAFEHNQPAVGQFTGTIAMGNDKVVPVSFDIVNNYLANDNSAQLRVTVRIGLFGGVTFYTESVNYNYTSGLLSASFGKGAPAVGTPPPQTGGRNQNVPLEFTAIVRDHQISQAVLKPAHAAKALPVTFNPLSQSLFTDDAAYAYTVSFGKSGTSALLSLSPRQEGENAPENVDLPQVPALLGDIRFDGLGQVANSFQRVIYDPLIGQLDLIVNANSRIKISGVGIPAKELAQASGVQIHNLSPLKIDGFVMQGGVQIVPLSAKITDANAFGRLQPLPPLYYSGTLYNPQGDMSTASAVIDYQGTDILNPAEFSFPNIPQLGMKIYQCQPAIGTSDKIGGQLNLAVFSIDQVKQKALFREQNLGKRVEVLFDYSAGWHTLTGHIRSPKSTRTGDSGTRVVLHETSESTWQACP